MLIFLELVRQIGDRIYAEGPPIGFGRINRELLMRAFRQILQWHKQYMLDDYHDPRGQNSVLNACRILLWAETNRLFSKTEGGEVFLKQYPANLLVQKALGIRRQQSAQEITEQEVREFIESVERALVTIEPEKGSRKK